MKKAISVLWYALSRTVIVAIITLLSIAGAMNLMGVTSLENLTFDQATVLLMFGLFVAVFVIIAQEKITETYSRKRKK